MVQFSTKFVVFGTERVKLFCIDSPEWVREGVGEEGEGAEGVFPQ